MRTEIIQELEDGDPCLEMPWSGNAPDTPRYLDLKTHPELAERLPECRNRPELVRFLIVLNSVAFRTAKCDVWDTMELSEDEQWEFDLPHKTGSYIDVTVEIPVIRFQLGAHLRLAELIAAALGGLRVQAQLDICVRRCLFQPEKHWGYYFSLFVHAYGTSLAESEAEWNRVLRTLGEAWPGIEREFSAGAEKA